jgi:peptidylprolyl isomerase
MRRRRLLSTALAVITATACRAEAGAWHPLDPATSLVVDTSKGRIIVEMRPDLAPHAVERVISLAREHVYDGLLFHRVIDHFVDQTGNPDNKDGGTSSHPDLAPEFTFRLNPHGWRPVTAGSDGITGFLGASPIAGEAASAAARQPDGRLRAWGAYCSGVVGMGRQEAPGSANSEIFFMRDPARRLDHDYTVIGRVVVGQDVVRAIAVGEPPPDPDRMIQVRLLADIALPERPRWERMDEQDPEFAAEIARLRAAEGADFTICDLEVPVREAR